LIPFVIWREKDVSILPEPVDTIASELDKIENQLEDVLLDTNSKKDCELNDGIFVDDTCHYYEVLNKLCAKVKFTTSEKTGEVTGAYFENGCYASSEAGLYQNAKVGNYYDFG
jgi:hypothetical protein